METPALLTHRLGWGRLLAAGIVVVALLGALDALRRGPLDRIDAAAALGALAVACAAYLLGVRPAVVETTEALEVRNPLRTTVVPWSDLRGLRDEDVLVVETGAGDVRCFALPRRNRLPIMSGRSEREAPEPHTSALVIARIEGQAAALRRGSTGATTTTYATSALAALAIGAAAVVLAVIAVRGA